MRVLWVIASLAVLASVALADGAVFEKSAPATLAARAQTGDQRGLILFDGQRETLVVETEVERPSTDMAWVLPTPSLVKAADVCEVSPDLFNSLRNETSPRVRSAPAWGMPNLRRDLMSAGEAASPGQEAVRLHETAQVGAYTISTLTAEESGALGQWLRDHGYEVPDAAEPVFADYIERGWAFTAIRITDPGANRPGFVLKPLALTFDATQAVFPLLISSISAIEDPTEVTLYVVAPYRVETAPYRTSEIALSGLGWEADPLQAYDERATAAMREGPRFVLEYSRPREEPIGSLLVGWRDGIDKERIRGSVVTPGKSPRLTRLRARVLPEEMTADVTLSRSRDQDMYRVRLLRRTLDDGYGLGLGLSVAMGLLCLVVSRRRGEVWALAIGLALMTGGGIWLAGYLAQQSLVLGPVLLVGGVLPLALPARTVWGRAVAFGVVYAILIAAHVLLLWVQQRFPHGFHPRPLELNESLLTGAWAGLGAFVVCHARGARPTIGVMLALLASLLAVRIGPGPLGLAVVALLLAVVAAPSSIDPEDAITRRGANAACVLLSGALACLLWWASEGDLPLFAPPWDLAACVGAGLLAAAATYGVTRHFESPVRQAVLYALCGSAAAVFLLAAMCQ